MGTNLAYNSIHKFHESWKKPAPAPPKQSHFNQAARKLSLHYFIDVYFDSVKIIEFTLTKSMKTSIFTPSMHINEMV